ncbi:hypothetical protein AAG906_008876 [Vitis piasezkii]
MEILIPWVLDSGEGASLVVNSGEWHAGYKFVYEPFTDTLTSHLKKERRKKWDERHQESIAEAIITVVNCLVQKRIKAEDAQLKRACEDPPKQGNILSVVADSSPHGTHVAGIAIYNFSPKGAIVEWNCTQSKGEPTKLHDYKRFVGLVNEV